MWYFQLVLRFCLFIICTWYSCGYIVLHFDCTLWLSQIIGQDNINALHMRTDQKRRFPLNMRGHDLAVACCCDHASHSCWCVIVWSNVVLSAFILCTVYQVCECTQSYITMLYNPIWHLIFNINININSKYK